MAVVACVGIDTVEATDFPAIPVTVSFLVGPLRSIVGFSTCILVLAGRGYTGAFLIPNLGIVSSIVVLRPGIVWTVLPKVIVSVQAAFVVVSLVGRRFFGLLLAGWFLFHLVIPVGFTDCLQDCLDHFQGLGLVAFFQKVVPFPPLSWDIWSNYLSNCLALAQLVRRSVDKRETFVDYF